MKTSSWRRSPQVGLQCRASSRAASSPCGQRGSVATAHFEPSRYAGLADPFPAWGREAA
jgi:hypothetical protein